MQPERSPSGAMARYPLASNLPIEEMDRDDFMARVKTFLTFDIGRIAENPQ